MIKVEHQPWELKSLLSRDDFKAYMIASAANPLKYFTPNGTQENFINTVAHCTENTNIPVVLVTFANGCGKSTVSVHMMLNLIYGPQNGWFDYPIFRKFPFPRLIWYCSTAESIKDTIVPMIREIVPRGQFREYKDGKTITARMEFPGGWQINFKTFDQDPKTYESANVGLIIADEPMPEVLWKAVKSRRRMGAITLLPMTPLYTPPYILDELQQAVIQNKPGYYHLKADVYTACKIRGERGHLDPDIIDDMVEAYDPDEKEARAYGNFMYFSGTIYSDLNRDLHFVEPSEFPIFEGYQIYQVVDPHDARFSAAIWAAQTPEGRWIIFDEFPVDKSRSYWDFKTTKTVEDEVQSWIKIETKHGLENVIRILDRHFGWQIRGQSTLAQLYAEAGDRYGAQFYFIESYESPSKENEIQYGHNQVRQALKPLSDGKPGLVIYNTCYHTWNGMTHYIRKHELTKTAQERAQADGKIVLKYKDFPDTVRYLVCSGFGLPTIPEDKTPMRRFMDQETDWRIGPGVIWAEEEDTGGGWMDS